MSGCHILANVSLGELIVLLHSVVVTRCRVCPSDLASRGVVWSKLARVMECYDRLYQDDLTFLVEVGMYSVWVVCLVE